MILASVRPGGLAQRERSLSPDFKIRRNRFSLRPACIVGEALGQETQLSGLSDYHPDYSFPVKVIQKEAYGLGSDAFALVCVSFSCDER